MEDIEIKNKWENKLSFISKEKPYRFFLLYHHPLITLKENKGLNCMKYLYKNTNQKGYTTYTITKNNLHIASRKTKKEILKIYNECKQAEWQPDKLQEIKQKYKHIKETSNPDRYILKNQFGLYLIQHKGKYYGCDKNKENLRKLRDKLEKHNWDTSLIKDYKKIRNKKNTHKYICKRKNGTYQITRQGVNYGTWKTLEAAIEERNLLIEHDWTYDWIDLY